MLRFVIAAAFGAVLCLAWEGAALADAPNPAQVIESAKSALMRQDFKVTELYQIRGWHILFAVAVTGAAAVIAFAIPWIVAVWFARSAPAEIFLGVIVACTAAFWFAAAYVVTGLYVVRGGDLVRSYFAALIGGPVSFGLAFANDEIAGRKDLRIVARSALPRLGPPK